MVGNTKEQNFIHVANGELYIRGVLIFVIFVVNPGVTKLREQRHNIEPRNLKPQNLILRASSSFSRKFPPTKITHYIRYVLTLSARSLIVFLSTLAKTAFIFFQVDFCLGVNPGSTSIYHDRSTCICSFHSPNLEYDIFCT